MRECARVSNKIDPPPSPGKRELIFEGNQGGEGRGPSLLGYKPTSDIANMAPHASNTQVTVPYGGSLDEARGIGPVWLGAVIAAGLGLSPLSPIRVTLRMTLPS